MKIFELLRKKKQKDYNEISTAIVESAAKSPPECEHKWKDYNWYLNYTVSYGTDFSCMSCMKYEIYEPYVCLKCKKRKDIKLEDGTIMLKSDGSKGGIGSLDNSLNNALKMLHSTYPKIKPEAEIEDAIHDDIYVDREWLKWEAFLRGNGENPSRGVELKL